MKTCSLVISSTSSLTIIFYAPNSWIKSVVVTRVQVFYFFTSSFILPNKGENELCLKKMERLSVDNISFIARNSMSLSPKRASQVSLLAETQSDSVHHLDDRNWSWAYLRVWSFYLFYIFFFLISPHKLWLHIVQTPAKSLCTKL